MFDDTAIREAETKRKEKKKKKKNPEWGEMELFFPTLPEIQPPIRIESPPAPIGYRDRGLRTEP